MKKKLLKMAGFAIALSALADTHYDVLHGVGLSDIAVNYIKLFGLIVALLLPSLPSLFSKDEELDGIGGGGIKNPKP